MTGLPIIPTTLDKKNKQIFSVLDSEYSHFHRHTLPVKCPSSCFLLGIFAHNLQSYKIFTHNPTFITFHLMEQRKNNTKSSSSPVNSKARDKTKMEALGSTLLMAYFSSESRKLHFFFLISFTLYTSVNKQVLICQWLLIYTTMNK